MVGGAGGRALVDGAGAWVRGVAFSADGRGWAAAREDGSVTLGATDTGVTAVTARCVRGGAGAYAFTPGGKVALLGDAERLRELPTCRVGRLSFSFDLCEEQAPCLRGVAGAEAC